MCVCLCIKEVSDISRWLQTLYVIKGNLEFPIFPPPNDWNYVCTIIPCFLRTEPQTVCMLGQLKDILVLGYIILVV